MTETVVATMHVENQEGIKPVIQRVRHEETGIEKFIIADPLIGPDPLLLFAARPGDDGEALWNALVMTAQAFSPRIVRVTSGAPGKEA